MPGRSKSLIKVQSLFPGERLDSSKFDRGFVHCPCPYFWYYTLTGPTTIVRFSYLCLRLGSSGKPLGVVQHQVDGISCGSKGVIHGYSGRDTTTNSGENSLSLVGENTGFEHHGYR